MSPHPQTHVGQIEEHILLTPPQAPPWAKDRATLWNAAKRAEISQEALLAHVVWVDLPNDLSRERQTALVVTFAREQFVTRGWIADVTLHHINGADPQACIRLPIRDWGPNGFSAKPRDARVLHNLLPAWRETLDRYLQAAAKPGILLIDEA